MTSCSGTTVIPALSATSAVRPAVESVTTATRDDTWGPVMPALALPRSARDDVDQAGLAHDHLADRAALQRAYDGRVGQRGCLQLGGGDRRRHVQTGPDLALDLH